MLFLEKRSFSINYKPTVHVRSPAHLKSVRTPNSGVRLFPTLMTRSLIQKRQMNLGGLVDQLRPQVESGLPPF